MLLTHKEFFYFSSLNTKVNHTSSFSQWQDTTFKGVLHENLFEET